MKQYVKHPDFNTDELDAIEGEIKEYEALIAEAKKRWNTTQIAYRDDWVKRQTGLRVVGVVEKDGIVLNQHDKTYSSHDEMVDAVCEYLSYLIAKSSGVFLLGDTSLRFTTVYQGNLTMEFLEVDDG